MTIRWVDLDGKTVDFKDMCAAIKAHRESLPPEEQARQLAELREHFGLPPIAPDKKEETK